MTDKKNKKNSVPDEIDDAEVAEQVTRSMFENLKKTAVAGAQDDAADTADNDDTELEYPSVEYCCQHLARNKQDRFVEILQLMDDAISKHSPGDAPSIAEIMAEREAQEAGPAYHALMSLTERIDLLRRAMELMMKMIIPMSQIIYRANDGFPAVSENIADLLRQSAPKQIVEYDNDDEISDDPDDPAGVTPQA